MELERIWLVGDEFEKAVSSCSAVSDSFPSPQTSCSLKVFKDVQAVKEALKSAPITNSTILIKGSNSTRLYQLPELL
jgi:UDP-N-acetylmuramoyl-tripeptide--D-alanyl-D-alanine ligase